MAQPMAHPMGGRLILGGRGRNLWRNLWRTQWETVLFSAAERATHGATNRRQLYFRRPSAQPMSQPVGGSFILGGRARNPWRNQ